MATRIVLNPCVRCGGTVKLGVTLIGSMKAIRCKADRANRRCRAYVYAETFTEAERLWNEQNPTTPTDPPSRDAPTKEKL